METIAVAMSGGVDSSVAAALLVEAGHSVVGFTLQLVDDAEEAIAAARTVADDLGIAHRVLDGRDDFEALVLKRCWEEYARGRTPNPCVLCNGAIKFGLLLDAATAAGADALATGHHARLRPGPTTSRPVLARGRDLAKDQSYFLARLSGDQLRRARFPVGAMTKAEVRDAARQRSLSCAERPESQDTCLALDDIGGREGAFAETLRRRFGAEATEGALVDAETGEQLGRHRGLHRFTLGQRRGLGVSLGRRAYVASIDADSGRVALTTRPDALLARALVARELIWHRDPPAGRCLAQIRYRHRPVEAVTSPLDDGALFVEFVEPVAAVTPGQALVLYDGDEVIGGGWIERALDTPAR